MARKKVHVFPKHGGGWIVSMSGQAWNYGSKVDAIVKARTLTDPEHIVVRTAAGQILPSIAGRTSVPEQVIWEAVLAAVRRQEESV